jgi:hypothetical protein
MTRCGHVYCICCLLRYLEQEFNKRCPMCGVSVCRSDLREIFDSPPYRSSNLSPSAESNLSATFTLLLRMSGSLSPYRASTLADSAYPSLVLSLPPSHRSLDMLYSRVCLASPKELGTLWQTRLREIDRYRASCLASADETVGVAKEKTVPASPSDKRGRGWERPVGAVLASAPPDVTAPVPQEAPWMAPGGGGDVEYLPFLPEAEELIRQKLGQLETLKVSSIPPTAGALTRGEPPKRLRREDIVFSYQLAPPGLGEGRGLGLSPPAFLHPFCVRCLLNDQLPVPSLQPETGDASESLAPLFALAQTVSGPVLEVITERVSESGRKRFPFLRHLPLDSLYRLVEIDLQDCLREETYER